MSKDKRRIENGVERRLKTPYPWWGVGRFFGGMLAGYALLSLWQDARGQEAVLRHVRDHWVSGWITVPLAIAVLVYVIVSAIARALVEEENKNFSGVLEIEVAKKEPDKLPLWVLPEWMTWLYMTMCVSALIPHYFGLEGYIQHLRESWPNPYYNVPLCLSVILFCIVCEMRRRDQR